MLYETIYCATGISAYLEVCIFQNGDGQYIPLMVNRNNLSAMDSSSVLICKWQPPLRYQYFRNLLPDVPIIMCNTCFKVNI